MYTEGPQRSANQKLECLGDDQRGELFERDVRQRRLVTAAGRDRVHARTRQLRACAAAFGHGPATFRVRRGLCGPARRRARARRYLRAADFGHGRIHGRYHQQVACELRQCGAKRCGADRGLRDLPATPAGSPIGGTLAARHEFPVTLRTLNVPVGSHAHRLTHPTRPTSWVTNRFQRATATPSGIISPREDRRASWHPSLMSSFKRRKGNAESRQRAQELVGANVRPAKRARTSDLGGSGCAPRPLHPCAKP